MLAATADAEDRHFWFQGLRRSARLVLEAELAGRRVSRILDCGCGTGRNLDWLADYGSVAGVELSPTGLAVARRHHRPVVQGSVTHLPFADASVDLATSFDVLYCLPDEDERMALREMSRVLRPGGLALFNVAALDIATRDLPGPCCTQPLDEAVEILNGIADLQTDGNNRNTSTARQ